MRSRENHAEFCHFDVRSEDKKAAGAVDLFDSRDAEERRRRRRVLDGKSEESVFERRRSQRREGFGNHGNRGNGGNEGEIAGEREETGEKIDGENDSEKDEETTSENGAIGAKRSDGSDAGCERNQRGERRKPRR